MSSRNEAADRLRRDIEANNEGVWRDEILSDLNEALAAERRATVERIRERYIKRMQEIPGNAGISRHSAVLAILDEVASAQEEAAK